MLYGAVVSDDGNTIAVSSHGGPIGDGAEFFRVVGDSLVPICTVARIAVLDQLCIFQAHGAIRPIQHLMIAATGGTQLIVYDTIGNIRLRWQVSLPESHLMEFAIAAATRVVYAATPCRSGFGLTRIGGLDLAGHRPQDTLISDHGLCGDIISAHDCLVAVADSLGQGRGRGNVQVYIVARGVVLRAISIPSPVADMAFTRSRNRDRSFP